MRDVSPKDLMLALRAGDGHFDADAPLSAVMRAEIERDGTLQSMEGRILAGAGYFGSRDDPDSRVQIDEAQLNLRWNAGDAPAADAARGAVRAEPGQLHGAARRAGGSRARRGRSRSRAASWCLPPPTVRAIRR